MLLPLLLSGCLAANDNCPDPEIHSPYPREAELLRDTLLASWQGSVEWVDRTSADAQLVFTASDFADPSLAYQRFPTCTVRTAQFATEPLLGLGEAHPLRRADARAAVDGDGIDVVAWLSHDEVTIRAPWDPAFYDSVELELHLTTYPGSGQLRGRVSWLAEVHDSGPEPTSITDVGIVTLRR